MWEYSSQNVKISNFGHKLASQGRATRLQYFLRNSQRLYASTGSFFLVWSLSGDKQPRYKHFPTLGAFSLKFSIASSGETKDQIKKS